MESGAGRPDKLKGPVRGTNVPAKEVGGPVRDTEGSYHGNGMCVARV